MSNTIKIKQIDQTQLTAFVNDILDGTGAVYTANRALVTDGAGDVTTSSVTATELGYLSGVNSAIQTQLNAKEATITGAATTITSSNLTVSRALISNASGKIAVSSVTDTELGYVSGVTSAIQTQFNNLGSTYLTLAGGTMTGPITGTSNIVEFRNSTNAQTFRVYGAYTDASNYVRASLAATSTSVTLAAETAGTGADNVDVSITPTGTGKTILGGNVAVGSTSATNQISIYTASSLSESFISGISIKNNNSTGYANTLWYNDNNDIGQFLLTGSAGSISGTTIMARQAVFTSVGATNGLHFYTDTGPIYFTPGGGTTVRMIQLTNGNVGIGTTSPSNILSFGGNSARIIWIERHTTSDTAGNNLAVQAGGATSGATNKAGGYLDLIGGISTGTGEGGVRIKGYVAGSSGTSDNSASTMIEVLGNKVGFFGVTPVVRQTTGIAAATFVANTSAIVDDTATWGGYTAGQIVTALKNVGILT